MSPLLALVALSPGGISPGGISAVESSTVLRTGGFEVFLAAPEGWTIEARPNRYDGLPAVLFRKGEAFRTAKNVIFVNLDRRRLPEIGPFVANRRAEFLKGRPGAAIRPRGKILAGDSRLALVFDFDDAKISQHERRAYLETADGIATLFLQCATPEGRTRHAGAFGALIGTFRDLHAPRPASGPPG